MEPITNKLVRLRWTKAVDPDVLHGGRVYVRHSNLTDGSGTFSSSVDLISALAGNSTDVVVQVNLSCNFGIAACVSDPTSGLATQIQLAKNNVSENSSVIFKRFEWIKRNRNRNNLNKNNWYKNNR